MKKRLKSSHKLFFIMLFSVLFSGIVGSNDTPNLSDRIAPEMERIEALPRKSKAELNIEVTKVKSEPLEEFYIDRGSKNIYVDFSKKKENNPVGVMNAEDLEKKYNLLISDTLQSSSEVVGKKKTKARKSSQVMSYEVAEIKGKKMLKIPYENEPEKLYISVQENSKGETVKVYSIDIKGIAPLATGRPKLLSMDKGPTYYDEPGTFQLQGAPKIEWPQLIGAKIEGGSPTEFPYLQFGDSPIPETTYTNYYFKELLDPIPARLIKFKNQDGSATFDALVYLAEPKFENFSDTGGNKGLLRELIGNQDKYDLLAGYGVSGEDEVVKAKLVAQVQEPGKMVEILRKLRELPIDGMGFYPEDPFTSFTMAYVGEYQNGKLLKSGNSSGASLQPIQIFKNNVSQKLKLELVDNQDISIPFTGNGINVTGAILTPDMTGNPNTPHYLRSLNLTPTSFTLDNKATMYEIDASGTSPLEAQTTITNGDSELKVGVKYNNEYPTLRILNRPKMGTYKLIIDHYEPSGRIRLKYTLDIVIQNDHYNDGNATFIPAFNQIIHKDSPGMVLPTEPMKFEWGTGAVKVKNGNADQFPVLTLSNQRSTVINFEDVHGLEQIVNFDNHPLIAPFKIKGETIFEAQLYYTDPVFDNSDNKILKGVVPNYTDRYNLLGGYGWPFKDEKVSTKLVGQVEGTGKFTKILEKIRSINEDSVIITIYESLLEPAYVITAITAKHDVSNGSFYKNDGYTQNMQIPDIKYEKMKVKQTLKLELLDNKNISIPFTGNGINIPGATLTQISGGVPDIPYYMRSLNLTPTSFSLDEGKTKTTIDALGNSSQAQVTLTSGANELKLGVKYNSEYPTLTILNAPKAGIYQLNIKHYEPSGLMRMDYILQIDIKNDFSGTLKYEVTNNRKYYYDQPGLELPAGTQTIPISSVNAWMSDGVMEEFPWINLGDLSGNISVNDIPGDNTTTLYVKPESSPIVAKFTSSSTTLDFDMELYLSEIISSGNRYIRRRVAGTTDKYTSGAGHVASGTNETSGKIVAQLQQDTPDKFLEILKEFRSNQDKIWTFNDSNTNLKIFKGVKESGIFIGNPGNGGVSMQSASFNFEKRNVSESLELTLSDNKNYSIPFTGTGVNVAGAILTKIPSGSAYYMRSLGLTPTSFSLDGGTTKSDIDESGKSSQAQVTLTSGANELKLGVKYNDEYPTLAILNIPKAGTYKLKIQHYEPSGLNRLDYTLDIVIQKDYEAYNEPQIFDNLQDLIIEDKPGISIDTTPEFPLGSLGIDEYNSGPGQFPFIALGKQSPINDPARKSWSFNLGPAELGTMGIRQPVITAYRNSNFSKALNMNMWFSDAIDIQGATERTLKSEVDGSSGRRYNFLAAYGYNSSEKIKANDVRMKVDTSSSGIITEIINEFRKSTVREWKFESKDLEQITFGLGEYDGISNMYKVYDGKYSKNYPSIIFKKIDVKEDLILTMTKDMKWSDTYVPATKKFLFTENGVEILPEGTTLSQGTYYLRNLGLVGGSSYTVNGGEKIQIDSSGSSEWEKTLIKLDADKELEIGGRYVNGNFELTVYFYGKLEAGTYPLKIKLYEPSGLERADYTLNISVPENIYMDLSAGFTSGSQSKDDYLDRPGMQLPTGADIEIGTAIVGQYYEGTTDPKIERFPFIVMGPQEFAFELMGNQLDQLLNIQRGPITTTYVHTRRDDVYDGPMSDKEIKMELYFSDNPYFVNSEEKFIIKSGSGRMNFVGAFKRGKYLEKIEAKLRGIIQPESSGALLQILTDFRKSQNMFWAFSPPKNEPRQFHMAGGEVQLGGTPETTKYTVRDTRTRSSSNMPYPYLGFRKTKLSENLTLTVSDDKFDFGSSIAFTGSGINVPGATLSSGTLYMRSLGLTPSSFKLNSGSTNHIINASGNSEEAEVTLNNGVSNLVLNIKYKDEYPTFKITNKPDPGIYSLNMVHYEESGMERLTYNLNIVIQAEKEFEVTSSMEDIVIKPPVSPGGSATVQYPDNWVKVVQLVKTKEKFPVIGVNKPKWVIDTDRPLNPIAQRPLAALDLGGEKITVPVNIKETPYQNVEKFFVYDRGDMTNRNLAVGAYTDLSSANGSGTDNQVKVNFEMFLEKDHIDKILAYAETQPGDKIVIDYDKSLQDPTIYSIRGLQSSSTNKFTVSEPNILSYGIVPFPKIVVLKNEITNKNLAIDLMPSYTTGDKIIFDSSTAPVYDSDKIAIRPSNDNRVMEGLNNEHIIRLTLSNGIQKDYITKSDGSFSIGETIEKNGKTLKLHINYLSGSRVEVWASDISGGAQEHELVLQHLNLLGDVRKTINMRISSTTGSRKGEMDFVISSRYNPAESGLNSSPLAITSNGIVYEKQVLDLSLLNGNYPEAPGTAKEVYVNDKSLGSLGGKGEVTLVNGTVLRITKESNGDLKIKPLYWNYSSTDVFKLTYKIGDKVTDEYTFNVKCPNFFVASMGELDFGRIYKSMNTQDVTKTTNIELRYNSSIVQATYSLDVSQADSDNISNSLYLNDGKTLLVKDLTLGEEKVDISDGTKRTLPLTGTIDAESIQKTPEGKYQKTIQILIHLK